MRKRISCSKSLGFFFFFGGGELFTDGAHSIYSPMSFRSSRKIILQKCHRLLNAVVYVAKEQSHCNILKVKKQRNWLMNVWGFESRKSKNCLGIFLTQKACFVWLSGNIVTKGHFGFHDQVYKCFEDYVLGFTKC